MARTEAKVEGDREGPGRRGNLWVLGFYAAAALVLTWPLAISLGQATGLRGDYFNNLWNMWWVARSIGRLESPWFTDLMYAPEGLSLMRHTLSPLNALAGAFLSMFMGLNEAFNVLVLVKLTASAYTMYVLARYVTGSRSGAVLAGLVYAFNPFHFSYICQINVFTFEFIPLALYFFLRVYREGGRGNASLAVLSVAALAATTEYYVVYTYMVLGLLLACGRWVAPEVPWRRAALRTTLVAGIAAVAVVLVCLPLLIGTWEAVGSTWDNPALVFQRRRSNDLVGYGWVGGPERVTVSWPTMLGYSTIALLVLGWREVKRYRFWLVTGAAFLVLSLGKTLHVYTTDLGFPLPYQALVELPVLSMLRKPDRCFMIVQLVVALLCAGAWQGLAARLPERRRRLAWWGAVLLIMLELTAVPFDRFDYEPPRYMEVLAQDSEVESVIELPPMDLDVLNARYLYFQTVHGKKEAQGYCTALALTAKTNEQMEVLVNGYLGWVEQIHNVLPLWIRQYGVDVIIHHKTMPLERAADESINTRVLWAPFFFVRRKLVGIRQMGQYLDEPLDERHITGIRIQLFKDFGAAIYEDEDVIVYRVSE